MKQHLESLFAGKRLPTPALDEIFATMFEGRYSDAEIAGFLVALRILGETSNELIAGANAMRHAARRVLLPPNQRPLVDTCGTGGDGSNTFNISTAAAIVAAAAGLRIAKHGNRSISSQCGSADLIFKAGMPDNLTPERTAQILEKTGFTFFFAPQFHPVMKHVMPVRKNLGVRTIFNLLGPLANPISPEYQVIGVGHGKYLRPMAEAIAELGIWRALVVHSEDGLDEISPEAKTNAILVNEKRLEEIVIDPDFYGLKAPLAGIRGGDAAHNCDLLRSMLIGEQDAIGKCVALNAGAVLWVAEKAADIGEGAAIATKAIKNGTAREFFENCIKEARQLV